MVEDRAARLPQIIDREAKPSEHALMFDGGSEPKWRPTQARNIGARGLDWLRIGLQDCLKVLTRKFESRADELLDAEAGGIGPPN